MHVHPLFTLMLAVLALALVVSPAVLVASAIGHPTRLVWSRSMRPRRTSASVVALRSTR